MAGMIMGMVEVEVVGKVSHFLVSTMPMPPRRPYLNTWHFLKLDVDV